MMKYFDYLPPEKEFLFLKSPVEINNTSEKELIAYGLGATLYMPATRENFFWDIIHHQKKGMISTVICLEDAIGDNEIEKAEKNVIEQFQLLSTAITTEKLMDNCIPFIFLRVRSPEQMLSLVDRLEDNIKFIIGFVFPKFSSVQGSEYFRLLDKINHSLSIPLYGMPVLETRDIIFKETRVNALNSIKQTLDHYHDLVLNVRIGATDFSSLFGIRRSCDITIYDIAVVRDCIADIINVFSRVDEEYVISGPVWEYFSLNTNRVLKPQLRQSLFEQEYGQKGRELRTQIIDKYIDGLIHEVILDKANGLTGKTVIHPSHIKPVQALSVVTHEDYSDACSILSNGEGSLGVFKSNYENKMNEVKPHTNWARKIILKSKIYGVFNERHNFTSLLK